MNLNKLFPIQKELDTRIEREKGLEGQDLLDKKILALQVELGELANEWRGFKFWSKDQEPRNNVPFNVYGLFEGQEEPDIEYKNLLLEEYVDCLHFILSIGLEKEFENRVILDSVTDQESNINHQFNVLFDKVGDFYSYETIGNYVAIVALFLGLGEMLGFTWEQIEQAYLDKNKVNHERQANGY
ncbi:dUTP diphosphatase [Virgibacillus sp. Bac332]|uniref:dUTP diphosphatase n=1 Tax=Virgibacillus sp. Bac332 TaxID=2419842 RepID=UPI000EF45542|nr:dUTP diphosphatase [Virgibacillus sp. Bac332]